MRGVFLWEDLEYVESPESNFILLERLRASHLVLSRISSDVSVRSPAPDCSSQPGARWTWPCGLLKVFLPAPRNVTGRVSSAPCSLGCPPVGVLGDTCVPLGGGGASLAQLSHALWLNLAKLWAHQEFPVWCLRVCPRLVRVEGLSAVWDACPAGVLCLGGGV